MKVSVSLPDDDVTFLDEYARSEGYKSRSAVVHRAVRLLRATRLGEAYADAWQEWDSSEMSGWDNTTGDGLANT